MSPTFTFESLSDEAPQHLSTVVTEGGGLVGVDVEGMGSDLEVFNGGLGYSGAANKKQKWNRRFSGRKGIFSNNVFRPLMAASSSWEFTIEGAYT